MTFKKSIRCALLLLALCSVLLGASANAAPPPPENPQNGSSGLQGTVQTPPPSKAATINSPTSGQSFNKMPITVTGLCTTDLLVKIFANNVFVGSVICTSGSYTIQVTLLDGRNDLVARIFDALDQPGPDSNIVTVNYTNTQFGGSGVPLLNLSSIYARRGANPGEQLVWPIIINGGTSPYALSVDWGDGQPPTLYSEPFAGSVDVSHIYKSSGIYVVIVKATDKNGQTAFLQLVAQANGAVTQSASGKDGSGKNGGVTVIIKYIWWPILVCIALIILAFWLGRKYEITTLRKNLERPR